MEKSGDSNGGIRRWFSDRWPVSLVLRTGLVERIDGGSRFAYALGSATLFLFILQVLTGTWELFYYVPTVDHAYDSVSYLRSQVPFGWLIHGLHYWGANAFVLVVGVHMARVFIWGAYKKPRELIWLSGVLLLVLSAALIFTGAILPWDTLGYWAGEVGITISGTVPVVGDFIKALLRGGATMSQFTLSRFFVFHAVILPALTVLLILLHIVAFRQFGNAGPWKVSQRTKVGWFWPDQIFKDLIVVIVIFLVLVGLCAFVPAPLTGPADPLDSSYTPKPGWNFLFLYQSLKVFKGPWEQVGTVGIPGFLIGLLVLLPLIDRRAERNPAKRPVAMTVGVLLVAGILALTIAGYLNKPPGDAEVATSNTPETPATSPIARAASAPASAADVAAGHDLSASMGCGACHAINGTGGTLGPDLSGEAGKDRSQAWLVTQIRDPKAHNANSIMPPYTSLTSTQMKQMVGYLSSLSSAAASKPAVASEAAKLPPFGKQGPPGPSLATVGSSEHGQILYQQFCMYCHGTAGGPPSAAATSAKVRSLHPFDSALVSDDPTIFAGNIDRFIQHGSLADGPDPRISMPAFGDTRALTQPQIANIEAYVMEVNGVDRARIDHPGVEPRKFFWLCLAVFGFSGLALAGVWRMVGETSRARQDNAST